MSDKITIDYKGHTLELNQETGNWLLIEEGNTSKYDSNLASLKAWIDAREKRQNRFKRQKAYASAGWNSRGAYEVVEVTSVADPEGKYVWIVRGKNKRRSKERADSLVSMTPQSTNMIDKINTLAADRKELVQQMSDLVQRLPRFELKEGKIDVSEGDRK